MPKIRYMSVIVVMLLLGLLAGCGGGDKGPVGRVAPQDLVTGVSGTDGGPGGGGSGGMGACVFQGSSCINNFDGATCSQNGGVLSTGVTCQSLGYTNCQNIQGYQVCY